MELREKCGLGRLGSGLEGSSRVAGRRRWAGLCMRLPECIRLLEAMMVSSSVLVRAHNHLSSVFCFWAGLGCLGETANCRFPFADMPVARRGL